jgi:hypothetical protein
MSFDMFCKALVFMAFVAYRDADPRIQPQNKVKAILLYMWKAVNDNEKTARLVASNRANTLSQFAGSLNVFGSGAFSDLFLNNWLKDGFIDYATHIVDDPEKSGVTVSLSLNCSFLSKLTLYFPKMLKSVLSEGGEIMKESAAKVSESAHEEKDRSDRGVDSVMEGIQKSLNLNTVPKSQHKQRTNSVFITHFSTNLKVRPSDRHGPSTNQGRKRMGNNLILEGKKLSELLQLKPELSEFLYMEIENMKISTNAFDLLS